LGGLWLGLSCAEHLTFSGVRPPFGAVLALGLLLLLGGLSALVRLRRLRRIRALLALAVGIVCGLSFGTAFWVAEEAGARDVAAAIAEAPDALHTLVVVEDPRQGAVSPTSLAVLEVAGAGRTKVRVFWDDGQDVPALGTQLVARVTYRPLEPTQAFLHQKGVFGSVTLEGRQDRGFPRSPLGLVHGFREHNRRLIAAYEGEGSALLRGVLLGDTTALDAAEADRAFKVTGLSHLIAVSGSHLVVIALLILWILRRLGARRSVEAVLVSLLLVGYVLLTGLQPSAIRACVMTLIASLAGFVGRRGHAPSALAAAAAGMVLLYPPTAFSVGFWLSVYAVFGLTLFSPLVAGYLKCLVGPRAGREGAAGPGPQAATGAPRRLERWLARALPRRLARVLRHRTGTGLWRRTPPRLGRMAGRALGEPLALTVTAQAATLPLTAPLFATISVVSPFANLLVTPFVTVLVAGGIVVLCAMPLLGPLGPVLLAALCAIAELSIGLASRCAQLPYACLPVSVGLVAANVCALLGAVLLYRLWPQPSARRSRIALGSLALVALLLFSAGFLPVRPQMVMLDVGQGDALLIREGRRNILIDTGPSDAALLRALARQRVGRLDAVVVTHLDTDHCGALDALSGTVPVGQVYFAAGLPEAQASDEAVQVAQRLCGEEGLGELAWGDVLDLGGIGLTVLWPERPAREGGNEESVCLALGFDSDGDGRTEVRALLTGDAESPQLDPLLARAADARFDVLKVGHHGSKGAVSAAQLERMGCRLALISVGEDNRYNHPTPETLSLLEQSGAAVYRTDLNGDIVLWFERGGVRVRCDTMDDAA
jgi:competence protein ComEC